MAEQTTLTANTGTNDPNSVYAAGFLQWVSDLGKAAVQVTNTVEQIKDTAKGKPANNSPLPATNPAPSSAAGLPAWLPWALGGALALVLVLVLVRK